MRSLPEWLRGDRPERSSTSPTLRRTTGSSRTLVRYAAEENSPRKRRSPTTLPELSNTLKPM
jgi:hypothetical protein